MWCYFLHEGRIAGVEVLPPGLLDEDAIARALILASKRRGPFDGFELWDGPRLVIRHPDPCDDRPEVGRCPPADYIG
jgi:hypothetical protein